MKVPLDLRMVALGLEEDDEELLVKAVLTYYCELEGYILKYALNTLNLWRVN